MSAVARDTSMNEGATDGQPRSATGSQESQISTSKTASTNLPERPALTRHVAKPVREKWDITEVKMRRWEIEVSNGVGSSTRRAELLGVRKGTSKCRITMKCAGERLTEFFETAGSTVHEDEAREAEERSQQRRSEQKQAALKAEVAKAAERAARLMAKRNKARNARERHELRIRSEAAQKIAMEDKARRARQAQEEVKVVEDICMSREARAHANALDDSLQKVMEWAMPPPLLTQHDVVLAEARLRDADDAVVQGWMSEKPKQQQNQLAKEALAANDDETIKRMLDDTANSQEALETALGLDRRPLRPLATETLADETARLVAARDDNLLQGLVQQVSPQETQAIRDANAIKDFMAPYASMQAQAQKDADAIGYLLEQPLGFLHQEPMETTVDAPSQELNDIKRIQQMMGPKVFLPITGRGDADDAIVANLLGAGDHPWKLQLGTTTASLLPRSATNDDDAMRRLLSKAPDAADGLVGAQAVRDVNALHSLIGEPSGTPDTRTVEQLMSQFSGSRAPTLYSPLSGAAMPLTLPVSSSTSPFPQEPRLQPASGAGHPESLKQFMGRARLGFGQALSQSAGLTPQAQDISVLRGLMNPVSVHADTQAMRDVDMLHHLIG